jgi:hypothetical protein
MNEEEKKELTPLEKIIERQQIATKKGYEKWKDFLTYTGIAMAIISAIVYLIVVFILINGFEVDYSKEEIISFLLLGAATGVMINISMRIQGLDLARLTKRAKEVQAKLNDLTAKSKETKLRPLWVMHLTNTARDILIKGGTITLTMYFAISISYKGLGEQKYMLLAFANVFLYFGLSLITMNKSYDYYIDKHIPFMEKQIFKLEEERRRDNATNKNDRRDQGNVREDGRRDAIKVDAIAITDFSKRTNENQRA